MASWRRRLLATLAVLAAAAGPARAAGARIDVRTESVVAGDVVRLADLATLDGAAALALADVVLTKAPGPGEMRTLDGAALLGTLERNGLDTATVTYSIPALVRVKRAGQEIGAGQLIPVVERYLGETLGAQAFDAVVQTLDVPSPLVVPAGAWDARVVGAPSGGLVGRVRLQIEIRSDGKPVKTVWATAELARYAAVVVTKRAVAVGETLGADDVGVEQRDLALLPRDVVADLGDAVGARVRAPLAPATPLRRSQLGTAPAVKRGAAVQLVAERHGLRITAAGEVRADAARGEQVRVVNRDSGKQLVGFVVDGQTVAVEF